MLKNVLDTARCRSTRTRNECCRTQKYPLLMYSKEAIDLNDLTVKRHGSPLLISSTPFLLALCIFCSARI